MSTSVFNNPCVIRQRLFFDRAYEELSESIRASFNFDLKQLPVEERAVKNMTLMDGERSTVFKLNSGHTVYMTERYQCSSQAGAMLGVIHPLGSFGNSLIRASRHFPDFIGVPFGLAPVLHCYPRATDRSNDDMYLAVPMVCTIALFESQEPAKDKSANYSSALLIWFQDSFDTEIDARTRGQILELKWDEIAIGEHF